MTRVAAIGGSMASLCAGQDLHNLGLDVHVFERANEELASRGAGIAPHDELYRSLAGAGVHLRDEMGVRSAGRLLLGRDGSEIGRLVTPLVMTS